MTGDVWRKFISGVVLCSLAFGVNARAQSMKPENKPMQFSYTTNGAADGSINTYGNNSVSVSGDLLRIQIGDSDGNLERSGVGIYEMRLNGESLEAAKRMSELLCAPKAVDSNWIIPVLYAARCSGEMRNGYLSDLGRDVVRKVDEMAELLINASIRDGRKIVKLDLSLVSIDRIDNEFLVSIRFENRGDYLIQFMTPDRWETRLGKNMDSLAVNDSKNGLGVKIGFGLAGQALSDSSQFPDGEVNLAPHSSVVIKIKTNNIQKFSAGTYDLYAGAFMNIKVVGIESSLTRVDFHSDYEKPTRITFDRGYPSNPEEREQWEVQERRELSYFPVSPGETFKEDGLYRAVGLNYSTHLSLQLVSFKAGAVATNSSPNILIAGSNGLRFDSPVKWLWEGSAPTPVKQHSSELIDGTQQFCKPGMPAPRSGRWLPRWPKPWASYDYDEAGIITMRRGQIMPISDKGGKDTEWEWIGP